ncbi:hypothetical protein D9757_012507 [Collybiopsis confluens]|uniref:NACHT domain-containing protein n=1 Tax=Collybiopsis confluens TaxID=2823264 RepID=A0A8H5D246_9AGAR|nr:hypothetical protein D9757_012507 [Collybiopsis confluens]
MFSHSHDFVIEGGTFHNIGRDLNISVQEQEKYGGLLLLHRQTSTSAPYDAEARYPPPRVHPGTRAAILASLEQWITPKSGNEKEDKQGHGLDKWKVDGWWDDLGDEQGDEQGAEEGFGDDLNDKLPIRWLYGPAGAGKSAIAQTFAEMCTRNGTLAGSFFFWRDDPSRNNPQRLFTTIASQLARERSDLRLAINDAVLQNPLVLTSSIEAQFDALVVQPGLQVQPPERNRVLIIDGLDECSDSHNQQRILSILSDAIHEYPLPFNRILIASRPEPRIKQSFNSSAFDNICSWIPLDDTYQASRDIRLFLKDGFAKIFERHSHSLMHIPLPWPTANQIEHLTEKSSGQFIYPSTVLKYIDDNSTVPADRLNIVLGLEPSEDDDEDDSPFADLDALYRQILSVPKKPNLLVQILGAIVVSPPPLSSFNIKFLFTEVLSISMGTLYATLSGLHSVFKEPSPVDSHFSFCHASFPDFLYDRKRSLQFFIDKEAHHDLLAQRCLDVIFKWFPECCQNADVDVNTGTDMDMDNDSDFYANTELNLSLHPIDAAQKYPILEHFGFHVERASGTEQLLSKLKHFNPWPLTFYVGFTTYEHRLKDKCIREMAYLVEAAYRIQK